MGWKREKAEELKAERLKGFGGLGRENAGVARSLWRARVLTNAATFKAATLKNDYPVFAVRRRRAIQLLKLSSTTAAITTEPMMI